MSSSSSTGPVVTVVGVVTACLLAALPSAGAAQAAETAPLAGAVTVTATSSGPRAIADPPPDLPSGRTSGPTAGRQDGATPSVASYPLDQTFSLHSLPTATRTIYLDLDGMVISGTRWNSAGDGHPALAGGSQPGWSTDASPAFSDAERTLVQDVWQAVAEDYAPFGVDVTTEPPAAARLDRSNAADQEYGVTALVTGSASGGARSTADDQLCGGSCGGLAYNGVFSLASTGTASHAAWQPAFVFADQLGDDAHAIADAVSHEVGHNLGLDHDGTSKAAYYLGQGAWGPVMGSPSNYPITQWSRGEYADANQTQDDVAIIGAAGGATTRADEAGSTVPTAAALPAASGAPRATGIISSAGDVDVFALGTCSGPVSVSANPAAAFSPDVDLSLTVLDSSGAVITGPHDTPTTRTSRTVAAGLGATASYDAGGGRPLWVAVDGVGSGSASGMGYSDYGSLGRYLVTVSGLCSGSAGAPGAPATATAVASGTSLTVAWTPPVSSGSSAVASYAVSLSPGSVERQLGPDARMTAFTGLAPGQTYTATVMAYNATVPGIPRSAVAVVPAVVPGAPTAVTATATADGTATVTWGAPIDDGGDAVTGYRFVLAGLLEREVDTSVEELAISGLAAGQSVVVSIQARNDAGLGPAAGASVTVPAAAAGAATGHLRLLTRPVVTGAGRIGSAVRVSRGTWSRSVTLRYQWYAGRTPVKRATRASFRPTAKLAGRVLSVRVTATAPGSPPVVVTVAGRKVGR